MKLILSTMLMALTCGLAAPSIAATPDLGDAQPEEAALVGGTRLKLNGAGLGRRIVFTVYSIGLYLPELRTSAEQVFNCDGPRRIAIQMLRDVSGDDFRRAVAEAARHDDEPPLLERVARVLDRLGATIARQPQGLRKGDRLTLDWVPGTGTVVELNRQPLIEAVNDKAVYEALLTVWLGRHSSDQGLRARLLGQAPA